MFDNIRDWLEAFQNLYTKRDESELDEMLDDLVLFDQEAYFIGTDFRHMGQSRHFLKKLIYSQWLNQIDLCTDEAIIKTYGDYAFVYSTAHVTVESELEKVIEETKVTIQNQLDKIEDASSYDHLIRTFMSSYRDAVNPTQVYPMRFTAILKRVGGHWKAHHLQYGLDAVFLWQFRYLMEKEVDSYFEMPPRQDHTEIRDLLQAFQKGYTARDVKQLETFMTLFVDDPNMISIGTDADEFLVGRDALEEIVESDWLYWGDFELNINGAIIAASDDFAYFFTQGKIHQQHTKEVMLDSLKKVLSWQMDEIATADGLLKAVKTIGEFRDEMSRGKDYFAPMRFSGYCVKVDGKWKFAHVQYSDYMEKPEKYL